METLILFLQGSILVVSLYFLIKNIIKGLILNAIVIIAIFPTISSIIGIEKGKAIILVSLYILLFLCFSMNIRFSRKNNLRNEGFKVAMFLFFCSFIWSIIITPSGGSISFNQKLTFSIIEIFLPSTLIILFGLKSKFNLNYIFNFFEIISLLGALLLLTNAYTIGFHNIMTSSFMERVEVGQSNVIWTGRLISIGFLIIILNQNKLVIKLSKIFLLLPAMLLTGSKSVLLFPLISILFYIFFLTQKIDLSKKVKLISLVIITVIGIFSIFSILDPLAVEKRFSSKSGTIDARKNSIEIVFDEYISSNNILFGNGLSTSGYPLVYNYDVTDYPHNIVIEMLYETGLIGVLIYFSPLIIPFLLFFKVKHKLDKKIPVLVSCLFMFLFYAQTSGNMVGNSFVFILAGFLYYEILFVKKTSEVKT